MLLRKSIFAVVREINSKRTFVFFYISCRLINLNVSLISVRRKIFTVHFGYLFVCEYFAFNWAVSKASLFREHPEVVKRE